MKTTSLKYISTLVVLLFLIACSTNRNTFLSRNSHALSTEYNILYHGGVALDKGIFDLKTRYKDDFWETLPIERMQVDKNAILPGQTSANPNFERAETKAIKAIQKHSMNIGGNEKNPQIDEAYLILGKARYYDQRFVPALEAFNYILYKYPNSDKIYEAKIWREKTNIRMENDALAVNNLRRLLKEIKFKDQIFADANAILSQAFLNLEEKDSAVAKLKLARDFTKSKEEKARYNFILGQLYEKLEYKDSAFASYQTVINMKRKAPKQYVIHAHARQAEQFDFEKGDTVVFLKKFNRLLVDRENRPYLDVLNHQMALFYDKKNNFDAANKYYNASLKSKSQDLYLTASNYRNLATIYFNRAKYVTAGKYYDSTLTQLNTRSREFKAIKKKRENLVDVIKYEAIATRNDSIIKVFEMPEAERISYYEDHISNLKKEDEMNRLLLEKKANEIESQGDIGDANSGKLPFQSPVNTPSTLNNFYFYNPTTVAYGKNEFKKKWGDRSLQENWRISSIKLTHKEIDENLVVENAEDKDDKQEVNEKYSVGFYTKQLPKSQSEIDTIARERNFAYYQLGSIYKEKFKEYKLAVNKYETLLENKPEERLVLPSMYNLYKIYQIIGYNAKELEMKNKIIAQFPESRYAQIISNTNPVEALIKDTPESSYDKSYKLFQEGEYRNVLTDVEAAIDQFTGEEIIPKFELLKAITAGKLKGLEEFKKGLNFVALNYPNDEEGKKAEQILANDISKLESLQFYAAKPLSWKIIYEAGNPEDINTKVLQDKIKKFLTDREFVKITMSNDIYTMDKNFVVIHGMNTEEYANGIASILKEFKDYKIPNKSYVISNDNYKIVQIKKNFEEYLTTDPTAPIQQITNVTNRRGSTGNNQPDVPIVPQNKLKENKQKKVEVNTSNKMLQSTLPGAVGMPPEDPDPIQSKIKN